MLADETRIFGEGHQAGFENVGGDDEAYFRLMTRLWSERHAFVIVEQDILPDEEQFASMLTCPEPWCAGVHKLHDEADEFWSLGCMRFGAALMRQPLFIDSNHRRWQQVDLALYKLLSARGLFEPHLHRPHGRNLHLEMQSRK